MRVEINNLTDQAFNSDIHEFVMGYTTDPEQINSSLQLWVGDIPDYCNSLSDAFLVIEKMRLLGKLFSIVNTLEGGWSLSVLQWSEAENCWEAVVSTNNVLLPRAVCEAAIQTVGFQSV